MNIRQTLSKIFHRTSPANAEKQQAPQAKPQEPQEKFDTTITIRPNDLTQAAEIKALGRVNELKAKVGAIADELKKADNTDADLNKQPNKVAVDKFSVAGGNYTGGAIFDESGALSQIDVKRADWRHSGPGEIYTDLYEDKFKLTDDGSNRVLDSFHRVATDTPAWQKDDIVKERIIEDKATGTLTYMRSESHDSFCP